MKKSIRIAFTIAIVFSMVMVSACRKSEKERAATAPQAHEKAMLSKYFEDSKKVAAAKVNGEVITMFSLLREMNTVAPRYLAKGQTRTPELDEKIRNDALNVLILQELAVQEAKKRGMTAAPGVIDAEIKKIKTKAGTGDAFQAYLDMNGLTEELLRKFIEHEVLFEMIATQEIDGKITVTEADLRARYKKEKSALKDSSHREITFEKAKGVLEQNLRSEAAEKKMAEWQKELKKNAKIEIIELKQKQG